MITELLSRSLDKGQKRALKAAYYKLKGRVIRAVASYTPDQLEAKFRALGVGQGDAVLMHSAFSQFNGFQGSAGQVIDCLLRVVGAEGHLFMMSMAYTGSSEAYLRTGAPFSVATTVSRMGLISESFRRREGVVRSANPLHPVLALGPRARWIVEGHDRLAYSCGPGSPLEKMLELDAKVLFFDVGFRVFTFTHYLEDRFKDRAPVRLYSEEPFKAVIVDEDGKTRQIEAYVFDLRAIERRDLSVLKKALVSEGALKRARIGNTALMLVRMADALRCAETLVGQGRHFYTA